MEIEHVSDPKRAKLFDCRDCKVQRLRRCGEDRIDFTDDDNLPGQPIVWPLYVEKSYGTLWGFCPGKAQWDSEAKGIYGLLKITAMTGAMLQPGALLDQPAWYIALLQWFLPRYDDVIFSMKAERVLGSPEAQKLMKGG